MEAFRLYKEAAKRGDARAQYNLSSCYLAENGCIVQDMEVGQALLQAAAEGGYAVAQCALANAHMGWGQSTGVGIVPENLPKVLELIKRAAAQGDAGGQAVLSQCYEFTELWEGCQVQQNLSKAKKLRLAAATNMASKGDAASRLMNSMMHGVGLNKPGGATGEEMLKFMQLPFVPPDPGSRKRQLFREQMEERKKERMGIDRVKVQMEEEGWCMLAAFVVVMPSDEKKDLHGDKRIKTEGLEKAQKRFEAADRH